MPGYHVADMTLEEKREFLKLQNSSIPPEDIGYGVSLFDENNRWLGGAAFVSPTSIRIGGSFIPEIQGTGIWIQCVPIMFPKLFEVQPVIYMESNDSAILNIIKNLGAVDIADKGRGTRVYYEKRYTTAYLGTTVNTDFMSKTELPPKAVSKYTTVDDTGNTETFKTLFID